MSLSRPARGALLALGVAAVCPPRAWAQRPDTARLNIYRFILGVDVPESPALVTLDATLRVPRGSAPKPIAASLINTGLALDIAPYFLLGGGVRSPAAFRAMSLKGRLTRVLTKTLLSVGAVRDPGSAQTSRLAVALRSTIHDPHDPALNSRLPEDVAAALAAAGAADTAPADDDVRDRGVDLDPLYAAARRAMRARAGDPQISFGWGLSSRVKGGTLTPDSVVAPRHAFWASAQLATGRRLDLLATVQWRDAFRSDARVWLGAGLERKTTAVDYRMEVSYDTRDRDWHPALAVDGRLAARLGVVAALAAGPARRVELRTLLHWFYASDR